jgi:hypothetical protein
VAQLSSRARRRSHENEDHEETTTAIRIRTLKKTANERSE